MARSTRLVILIKNIYTLRSRKRFLLPVTYSPTNLVYPFTLE